MYLSWYWLLAASLHANSLFGPQIVSLLFLFCKHFLGSVGSIAVEYRGTNILLHSSAFVLFCIGDFFVLSFVYSFHGRFIFECITLQGSSLRSSSRRRGRHKRMLLGARVDNEVWMAVMTMWQEQYTFVCIIEWHVEFGMHLRWNSWRVARREFSRSHRLLFVPVS